MCIRDSSPTVLEWTAPVNYIRPLSELDFASLEGVAAAEHATKIKRFQTIIVTDDHSPTYGTLPTAKANELLLILQQNHYLIL